MGEAREKRVRYAVVGSGNIAQVAVLPDFAHARENSRLVAIVSGDPRKRDVLGAKYGVATCSYDDLEATIAREHIDGKLEERIFERDLFAPELVRFSADILGGTRPATSGREGWADVRIMEAIQRSASIGRRVSLEPFDPGERPKIGDEMKKPAAEPPPTIHAPSPNRQPRT